MGAGGSLGEEEEEKTNLPPGVVYVVPVRVFFIVVSVVVVAILVIGFWIGCTVADLLNCIPIEWTWRNSLADPRYCFNYNIFWLASGIVEAIIDFLILMMPIKVILGLQLSRSKKVAVLAVFLLGIL